MSFLNRNFARRMCLARRLASSPRADDEREVLVEVRAELSNGAHGRIFAYRVRMQSIKSNRMTKMVSTHNMMSFVVCVCTTTSGAFRLAIESTRYTHMGT